MKHNRWIQLLLGLVCMIVISSPQYVWTLFTQPLMATLGARLARIQITFSILIVVQTFLAPCQGLLVDRFGPRALLSVGGALTGLSWVLAARATTLIGLYLTLRVAWRNRDRDRLRRRDRAHGAVVPRPSRLRHGDRRGRLRHGRAADDLPDCRVAEGCGLSAGARAIRLHLHCRRNHRGAGIEISKSQSPSPKPQIPNQIPIRIPNPESRIPADSVQWTCCGHQSSG